jgi:hypothetical protein
MAAKPHPKLTGAALMRMQQSIEFKRTIIPPMLTIGVLLPVFGLWILLGDEDMPLYGETAMAVLLLILGLMVLGAAVVPMLQVRYLLQRHQRERIGG